MAGNSTELERNIARTAQSQTITRLHRDRSRRAKTPFQQIADHVSEQSSVARQDQYVVWKHCQPPSHKINKTWASSL